VKGAQFLDPATLARIENLELLARTVVDGFIKGKDDVIRLDSSEIEVKIDSLPTRTQILLLKSTN